MHVLGRPPTSEGPSLVPKVRITSGVAPVDVSTSAIVMLTSVQSCFGPIKIGPT